MSTRADLLDLLAKHIAVIAIQPVTFVGVDGVDGAGKTCFADELSVAVKRSGRTVIRASVDHFHNPRSLRYRQGRSSPRGFFEDSYDYQMLRTLLLDPLGPRGTRRYALAAFDLIRDEAIAPIHQLAELDSVLICDGIFLHRDELRDYWHFSIWLEAAFDVSVARLAQRDGNPADPAHPANARYVEGQKLYVDKCQPQAHATVVVNNENLHAPFIVE